MRLAIAAAALVAASPAFAQETEPFALEEVVISGGLTPTPTDQLGRAVTIITAEEIEAEGYAYAADALRAVPGVAVSRTGSPGGVTVARIRGAESNHTQVYIDGVKVSSPDNLDYDFSGLLAAEIERIEVLRGPQSALLGANAIGGVINIVTKRATAPGFHASGSFEGGTDSTFGGDAAARWRGENAGLSVALAGRSSEGFDVSKTPGGEKDGAENLTLNVAGDIDLAPGARIGGTFRFVDRSSEFDQFNFEAPNRAGLVTDADLEADRREIYASAFAEADAFGGRLANRLAFGYADVEDKQFSNGAKTNETLGRRLTARAQTTIGLDAPTVAADHTLTAALDYERETFENTDPALVFDPSQLDLQARNQFSGAIEYRGRFVDAVDVQLGLRHDVNDDFEDFTSWSASASWLLPTETTRLHGSIGTGVQNPSLIDQFGFFPGQFVGNPNLEPEQSFGWDIGVEQTFWGGRAVVDATYFQDRLEDEIVVVFDPATFLSTAQNQAGKSKRRGVELSGRIEPIDGLTFGLAYTWIDAEDPDGAQEVRRPEHDFAVEAAYRFLEGRALVAASLNHVAGLTDSDFTAPFVAGRQADLEDRTLVNLSASFAVSENAEIYGRVTNLFDDDYEEIYGYGTEGRGAFVGFRARF